MKDLVEKTIEGYHQMLDENDASICDILRDVINEVLPENQSKIWHGHPVWFIDGNPIAGYSKLKNSVRLMFWSGQSFDEPGLEPEGSFKAAERRYIRPEEINKEDLRRWLHKAKLIQWDYKNIIKRKGLLVLLEPAEYVNRIPITSIKVSGPAISALQTFGIEYLDELSAYSEKELLSLHGFGKKGLLVLKTVLKEHDLSLKD